MLSFRRYLEEMPTIVPDYDKKDNQLSDDDARHFHKQFQQSSPNYKHVSSHKGHEIWIDRPNGRITAVKDGHVHMYVDGAFEGRDSFHVNDLRGHPSSELKAHELYHHILSRHVRNLHSSAEQSEGGYKTWKKLSDYPDVHMKHNEPDVEFHKGGGFWQNYNGEGEGTEYTSLVARKKR